MILPSKHLQEDRSLLAVGGRILSSIHEDSTVSSIWEEIRSGRSRVVNENDRLSFDWFILALDFLYIAGAIELDGSGIRRISG